MTRSRITIIKSLCNAPKKMTRIFVCAEMNCAVKTRWNLNYWYKLENCERAKLTLGKNVPRKCFNNNNNHTDPNTSIHKWVVASVWTFLWMLCNDFELKKRTNHIMATINLAYSNNKCLLLMCWLTNQKSERKPNKQIKL